MEIKQVYIGENFTSSNGSILNKYDVCTFQKRRSKYRAKYGYEIIIDRTGENLCAFTTGISKLSKLFIPLAEWRQQQIDKILEDD